MMKMIWKATLSTMKKRSMIWRMILKTKRSRARNFKKLSGLAWIFTKLSLLGSVSDSYMLAVNCRVNSKDWYVLRYRFA